MRYLVTGASGFVGRNLVEYLLQDENEVVAIVRDKKRLQQYGWHSLKDCIVLNLNDIQVNDLWTHMGRPECVFHMAWEGLPNYDSPYHLTRNLHAQMNFLAKLIGSGCPKVVIPGTCFEYGEQYGPLQEEAVCNPVSSYGIAKDSLRRAIFDLKKSSQAVVIWARLFYLYGKYQRPDSLLGQLNLAISRGERVFRMSGGEQLRDYSDVMDVVKNLCLVSQKVNQSEVINIGSGKPISVRRLVEDTCSRAGADIKLELGYYPYLKHEPLAFWADVSKLNRIISGRDDNPPARPEATGEDEKWLA